MERDFERECVCFSFFPFFLVCAFFYEVCVMEIM